jgi:hypothetical protein
VVLVAAAAFGLGLALRPSPSNVNSYGGLPSWLPKAKTAVNRLVQASAKHPQLAVIEGDSVSAQLSHGRVLTTAVGPTVPAGAAQHAQPGGSAGADVTCTLTVTFTAASGRVPINPRAFTIIDEEGQVSHLGVSAAGGGTPPAVIPDGKTVRLTMRSRLGEGEYVLRWAPAGQKVLVGWEFNVELD